MTWQQTPLLIITTPAVNLRVNDALTERIYISLIFFFLLIHNSKGKLKSHFCVFHRQEDEFSVNAGGRSCSPCIFSDAREGSEGSREARRPRREVSRQREGGKGWSPCNDTEAGAQGNQASTRLAFSSGSWGRWGGCCREGPGCPVPGSWHRGASGK